LIAELEAIMSFNGFNEAMLGQQFGVNANRIEVGLDLLQRNCILQQRDDRLAR